MLRTRLFVNLVPFVVILLATGLFAIVLFVNLSEDVETALVKDYQHPVSAESLDKAFLTIRTTTQTAMRTMVWGLIIAVVVASIACYRLARSIVEPVQAMTEASAELAEGNLVPTVPVKTNDELGRLASAFNSMADQLQAYRQSTAGKILRLHRRMEATLGSFPDPIFVLDQTGAVELQNPAARQLALNLGLDHKLPQVLREPTHRALHRGQDFLPNEFEAAISLRVAGREKHFLPRILLMRDQNQAVFGVAVVLYDITRFRLMDDLKTNLLATVNHELKTPLTGVRLALHILLEETAGPLNPKQRDLVRTARDDSERLLFVLNELLDVSKIERVTAQIAEATSHTSQASDADEEPASNRTRFQARAK